VSVLRPSPLPSRGRREDGRKRKKEKKKRLLRRLQPPPNLLRPLLQHLRVIDQPRERSKVGAGIGGVEEGDGDSGLFGGWKRSVLVRRRCSFAPLEGAMEARPVELGREGGGRTAPFTPAAFKALKTRSPSFCLTCAAQSSSYVSSPSR
jgi:hypothetical protein